MTDPAPTLPERNAGPLPAPSVRPASAGARSKDISSKRAPGRVPREHRCRFRTKFEQIPSNNTYFLKCIMTKNWASHKEIRVGLRFENPSAEFTILTNREGKAHAILSEGAERAFDKSQRPRVIHTVLSIHLEEKDLPSPDRAPVNPTIDVALCGETPHSPLRPETRRGRPPAPSSLRNVATEVPAELPVRTRNKNQRD